MIDKRILAGGLLLVAGTLAQADPVTWDFEFQGLTASTYTWPDGSSHFTGTLSGEIRGEDLNHDNIIDESELTSLTIGNDKVSGDFTTCNSWSGSYTIYCWVSRFAFAPNAPLGPRLDITAAWRDEGYWYSRTMEIETGDHYRYDVYKEYGGYYGWNDQVTLKVTQVSPVPEPARGAMLVGGLLSVALMRRLCRSRRGSSEYAVTRA